MKSQLDIEKLVELGSIKNELDYERALIADRKLRLLSKENNHFKSLRNKLRALIEQYERQEWNDVNNISDDKILESEMSKKIAELEMLFYSRRKLEIKKKLKELGLTQESLAQLLGHKSKTHMSELINGIKAFTLKDLMIIHHLLNIDFNKLIPSFLPYEEQLRINNAIKILGNTKLKIRKAKVV